MKITEDEEKAILQKRITIQQYDSKTRETTNVMFPYGLVLELYDIYKRLEALEKK
jgi:hypothetical protein